MNVRPRWQAELVQLLRFVFVGTVTVMCYLALYALLSRVWWPTGARWIQNGIATGIVAVLNYLGHRSWTFRSRASLARSGARYMAVLTSASCLQVFLFWLGHTVFHVHDLLVALIVPVIIPFYTFLMHRLYTFRSLPS